MQLSTNQVYHKLRESQMKSETGFITHEGETYSGSTSGTSSFATAFNSRRTTSAENPARRRLPYMEAIFFSSIFFPVSGPRYDRSLRSMRWRTMAASSEVWATSSRAEEM